MRVVMRDVALLLALLRAAPAAGAHPKRRRTLLVSHFYNEALLLPYWIAHHAPMFSSAILIDYNSTDGSAELVRQLAPRTWKVVPSWDGEFDAVNLDRQVMQWEMTRPDDWRIALTTTEFLVMPGFHELLAALNPGPSGHRVLHFHSLIAVGDDTIPLKPPSAEPLVCQRGVFVEPQRGLLLGYNSRSGEAFYDRFMHVGLGSNYVYTPGRHHMSGSVTKAENGAFYDGGIILKYMWTPWPETRSRKMQIGHKVSSRDRKMGAGLQHNQMINISTRAADERRAGALDGVAKYDGTGKAPTPGTGGGGEPAVPALALGLLKRWACGKGLHEHDGGAGGRDGRTKPWRASEACVATIATGGAAPSVAIIGAGGNIGARLHEVLSANCGWKVTGYDREPRLRPPRAKYPITPMSAASIPAAELAAYDAVVYLGGLTGRAACDRHTREQTLSENVDDPLALASRMGPSQLLVFASTSAIAEGSGQRSAREDTAVRTELLDSYSSSMHQREAAMRQLAASKPAGAPQLVGLRFGTVIGVSPGQRVDLGPPAMLKSAYTKGVLKVAHPETSRAFLWLEDLCRGISRTIELRRGGAASVGAPPATAHHSKRSAPSSSSMAPAAPPPFAIYHLSSFNSNVGALAAAIAARTGARIAASNHGTASKDVLGFSLNNSLFARTYNFTVRGSLAKAIRQLDGAVPSSLIGKGAHTTAVHVPPAADEPTPTDAACDGFKHDHAHCPHALTHAPPPPATNSGGVNVTSIRCPVCGSHDIQLALDLRGQPLANDFMKTTTEALRAEKFPLALVHCRQCHHMHLSQLVSRKRLFSDYMYVSGTSKTLLKHFEWLAQKIQADVETLPLEGARTKRAVLELACNDGSQLDAFARLGWKTYGVDPAANIVPTAVAKGHQVKVGFWGAQSVWPPEGKPVVLDAIVAQNVLAHVPSPTQFLKDCAAAMGPRTLLFIQTSQCAMHEDGQFDTAYHEHLSFFTSHSFERAATAAQLAVLSFETAPIHGISCLWKLKRADGESSGALAGGTSLRAKLDEEVRLGITTDFFYERYRMRAEETSAWLDTQLAALSAAGYRLGGYGAAAKGMVLLHFMLGRGGANAAAHSLEFVLDDAPMKQGTYCPGTTIPVRPTRSLEGVFTADEKPLALVMFAWNFAAELFGNLQKLLAAAPPTRSGRPRVVLAVLPFPTPRVVTLEGDTVAQMHYHPAQIGATYRGLVGAAGARRAVLLTSFADDAAVLPHWIRHHAHMFDEAMLLDCGSADASGVIIEREAPPTWRVVRAPNASSALHGCAHHLAGHAAAAAPHDWVFPLQLHELLVHGDLRGALAALDGQAGPPPLAATLQFPALQMAVSSAARAPADRFTDLATQRSQYHPAAPLATFRATTGAAKRHASGQVQALSSKDGFVLVYPPISTAHGNSNRGGGGRDAAADADTGDLSELYEVIARGPRPAGAGGPSGLWPTREAFALHRIFHEAGLSAPPQGRARQRRKRARQAYD